MIVDPGSPPVKGVRSYDASGRRELARQRHDKLLDVALHRFFDNGFAATTVEAIAEEAGVSSATIYKSYGGKPGLVRALSERALAGEGSVPAEARSDELAAGAPDADQLIEGWRRFVVEVAPRIAPILLLLRDAAGQDPVARALYEELDSRRLARMSTNAGHLVRSGELRPGNGLVATRDVLWLYSSPEIYELLVLRRGWSIRRFSRFVADAMRSALL